MSSEKIRVKELVDNAIEPLEKMGLDKRTLWASCLTNFRTIERYYRKRGLVYYDQDITADFVRMIETRLASGEIKKNYAQVLKKSAFRLDEMYETGHLGWAVELQHSKFTLNTAFESILEEFIAANSFHSNTKRDIVWTVRKYLTFLKMQGHESMHDVLPHDIQEFIIHCSTHLTSGSVSNILCYLRKFHKHLYDTQKYPVDCQKLLSIRITRENKIRSYMPEEEIDLTLKQVDLTTSLGKRDYSILLLGAFTGIRGVDVFNLQISAIDWYKHRIRIVQQKTGEPLILPLIPKVEEAIRNYLLFGRPTSNSQYVFLRDNAPFEKFVSAVAIDYILKKYQNKAGLNRMAFDGKGYHSFRRSLARQMVLEEVPVTTVAQVLGHSTMNSSKHRFKKCF